MIPEQKQSLGRRAAITPHQATHIKRMVEENQLGQCKNRELKNLMGDRHSIMITNYEDTPGKSTRRSKRLRDNSSSHQMKF